VKNLDAAYLAGLIDGEGCIGANISKHGYIRTHLTICMTDLKPLKWCKEITKLGNVYNKIEKRKNRKQPFQWVVSNTNDVAGILEQIIPFLKVKKEQAVCFLALNHLRKIKVNGKRQHKKAEEACVRVITGLKHG
jgi:hypothetical protein